MSWVVAIRSGAARRWAAAKAEHAWLAHVVRAWSRFQGNNGSQFAAAITYFSFLALFPLLLLAVSVVGFVLHSQPDLQARLFAHIADNFGSASATLTSAINAAVKARTGVGIVGLAGVLLSGLGWISNLRAAVNAVWGIALPRSNFVKARMSNLSVLTGLGLGVVVSLGVTAVGTALSDQVLRAGGIEHVIGISYLVRVSSVLVSVAGDMVIFSWILVRLPHAHVPRGVAFRGTLLASVGFEILKIAGTYTIAKSSHSPTLGPFAGILAVLIWIQLVSRMLLYCAAWTATGFSVPAAEVGLDAESGGEASGSDAGGSASAVEQTAPAPLAVAASLFGAGTVAGLGVGAWILRRSARRDG
jgi:membrane protein